MDPTMSDNQADRILDQLDRLLGPSEVLTLIRDARTGQVIVRSYTGHRGASVRDALAQYCQANPV